MAPQYCYHEKNYEQEFARFVCNSAALNNLIEDLQFCHGKQRESKIEMLLNHLETPGIHVYFLRREDAENQRDRILRLKANLQQLQDMVQDNDDRRFVSQFTQSVMRSVYH